MPHGVDRPPAVTPPSELRERYDIGDRPYVVYPALTHPHKNHRFLLDLLAGPWSDPDLALVLLGGRGLVEDEVAGEIAALELGPRVVRPGRVPGRRSRRPAGGGRRRSSSRRSTRASGRR